MILPNLLLALTSKIGTEVTTLFTDDKKINALNSARKKIITKNDFQEFVRDSDVYFPSGSASKPTGFLRTIGELNDDYNVKDLWNDSTDQDYKRVSITKFDDNTDYTWTIKEGSIKIYPAETVSLKLRNIYLPTDMADSDDSLLPAQLDDAHILLAAYILLFDNRQYEPAQMMKAEYESEMSANIKKAVNDFAERRTSSFQDAMDGTDTIFVA